MLSATMADMDITPELAEKVLRGGTDAIAVVRGIYQTQIQKLDAIERQASQMLEAAEMLPLRWIPVSERMPENGVDVLAYFDGRLYVGYYDGEEWQDDENFRDCEYWMPLPKPPEQP